MKFCPARRTLTIFTEPRITAEDPGMKVLPIQPWGTTPAPPVVQKKPPVSRKPEGPWPRARVTPMPPYKGVVNQGYQSGGNSPHYHPPSDPLSSRRERPEDADGMRRKREAVKRTEEEEEESMRREEEAKRKKEDEGRKVEGEEGRQEGEGYGCPGRGESPCECGRKAEEEAKLLRLHNVRLRQVASALASKLRASEAALGASRADADARLAALVRALLAFEAGLRREQTRIRSTMECLESVVRAQKAEIAVLKAASAAAGLRLEEGTRRRQSVEFDWSTVGSRGIRPASILRDVLRSQLGAAWVKREEELKKRAGGEEGKRVPAEGEERGREEGANSPEKPEKGAAGEEGRAGTERVKPPLPPRPRPRLTILSSDGQSCPEEKEASEVAANGRTTEDSRFRDQWSAMEVGGRADDEGGKADAGGGWGLNAHFEEFVLGEEATSEYQHSVGQMMSGEMEDDDQPPSTPPPPPPPSSPPPAIPDRGQFHPMTPPPIPAVKPRTALVKPPRKHPPINKHQATVVSPPPLQFLLPDLLCPTPRGPEGVRESSESSGSLNGTSAAYLKENALNGDLTATPRGHSKGRPLAPSALQNAIPPKGSEAAVEAAKGHCSYERFLEVTGLSQKSILNFHRPIPPPPGSSRPLPPPPPKHRSVLKPRDVKMRSKAARNVGWEDGFVSGDRIVGVVATESVVGATRRYWSGPYL